LSHAELIAILLRTGLKGANAVEIGRQLLQKFGTLQLLAQASIADLQKVRGIGRDKAVTLVAAFALARKMAGELHSESPVLDNPQKVVRLLREQNLLKSVETLQVLLLNTRRKLIRVEEISDGTLDTILVHPREVFKPAIAANAHAIVLAHIRAALYRILFYAAWLKIYQILAWVNNPPMRHKTAGFSQRFEIAQELVIGAVSPRFVFRRVHFSEDGLL
jgi:DNA repair protein RadC